MDGGEQHAARVDAHHLARGQVRDGDERLAHKLLRFVVGVDAGKDGAVFARAVVEREPKQLLALGNGRALLHLHRAEVGLAERVEVDLLLEQRLDDHLGEVDGSRFLDRGNQFTRTRCAKLNLVGGRRGRGATFPARGGLPSCFVPHVREKQHIPNARRIGKQHDQAVYSHTHAAGGRHAVFQRANVVVVEAHGLVVAHVLRLDLHAETLGLIHWVVQLGERVRVLVPANEQLEALREVRVVGALLGKGRHLERMIGHENGLHQLLLGNRLEYLGDELAFAPCGIGVSAVALQNPDQLFARAGEAYLLARILARQVGHGTARPFARKIDLGALVGYLQRAASGHGGSLDIALRKLHHAVQVGKRLIRLHGGELGVVVGVHALVAELAPDFKHFLESAHKQALQRQLGGNAQEVVAVERVEVRDERLRVRAAQNRVQKRRLDLVEALLLHVAANGGNYLEALLEHGLDLGVHDQIDIALAIARLLVGKTVELFRQRAQRLREQLERIHRHRKLAALRAHHGAVRANPVAHVKILHARVRLFAERVDAAEQLNVARRIAQTQKGDLSLHAL